MSKRKQISMAVTVSVPAWMTAAQARREVRTLINQQCNYMGGHFAPQRHGLGDWREVDESTVKARKVSHARKATP